MMEHGADIYSYAKKLKCKPYDIVDFSANINFVQPKTKFNDLNNLVSKYGDSSYSNLKRAVSKRYKIDKSKVALYNGASSAIFHLLRFLKGEKVYLYAPLYSEYEKSIPKRKEIYKINRLKNIYEEPAENSIVVFSNPSTPDGKYYNLQKLFKMWKKQNCTVILDESFIEFENLKSYRDDIEKQEKLYIVQSFSKFYNCAGLRVGAIFSNKKNIKKLKTPLWNISSLDAELLTARLLDDKFVKNSQGQHLIQKEQLKNILTRSKLFDEIKSSDSNFFLVKSKRARKIFEYLLKRKVLIRTCESFDYLDDSYLRFAVKDSKNQSRLAKLFEIKYKWYEKPRDIFLNLINKMKSVSLKKKKKSSKK